MKLSVNPKYYTRLNANIDTNHWEADDISSGMKEYLKDQAKSIIDSKEFNSLCDKFAK